jgi:hypothetical protein
MAMRELGRRGVSAGRFAAPEDVTMLLDSELDSLREPILNCSSRSLPNG